MITFKKNIVTLALTGALVGGFSLTAAAQQTQAAASVKTQTDVSVAELNKFADAFQQVQVENQAAQEKMMGIIKNEGLDVERFTEIQKAQMNPEAKVEATDEELKMHAAVVTELQKMQPELESKMQEIIADHGLTLDRYKAVAMALQQDKSLQQKFQGILMKKQTEG
ncbi:DUF4168 domain-containing protein [Leeuwenhoekiella marinoflava]|uniref:DUF4168 domain-containing protein n=2 Tax=Leeuwenhoekiella marinoflava TaxID=988 RepID=A0A4Q0PPW0_9FLAO|nr:DUF4168 domain-containing protein [Leeuwenhoekiella marinoflava]RXG32504.1 putative protein DUF4168 [Leeuwenhoekiella marinoflava]SHE69297.1 protein of unknown function [Leeuwenhoekiella marinoflava DSM 3653]